MARKWRLLYGIGFSACFVLMAMVVYQAREFLAASARFVAVSTAIRPAPGQQAADEAGDTERGTAAQGHWAGNPMFLPEHVQRRARADQVCMRLNPAQMAEESYFLMRSNMTSYCVIPKIACTFWISVFRFLNNDTRGRSSPLAMTRQEVHYTKWKNLQTYKKFATGARDFRFMFVREPYSRLWSAYVDKILLPDFWENEGVALLNKVRGKKKANKCGNDITFKEFIEYIVISKPSRMNAHWRPVFHLCNPCVYRPHLIGSLETFSRDARHVLGYMNASWVLDSADHRYRVENEVNQLIDFNFGVGRRKHFANCTNAADLAQRLWTAFRINGYIAAETPFPGQRLEGKLKMDGKELKMVVHEALASREGKTPESREKWRAQREEAMVQGFRTVPLATLRRLQDLYRQDFDMFGYDPEPAAIFRRDE